MIWSYWVFSSWLFIFLVEWQPWKTFLGLKGWCLVFQPSIVASPKCQSSQVDLIHSSSFDFHIDQHHTIREPSDFWAHLVVWVSLTRLKHHQEKPKSRRRLCGQGDYSFPQWKWNADLSKMSFPFHWSIHGRIGCFNINRNEGFPKKSPLPGSTLLRWWFHHQHCFQISPRPPGEPVNRYLNTPRFAHFESKIGDLNKFQAE